MFTDEILENIYKSRGIDDKKQFLNPPTYWLSTREWESNRFVEHAIKLIKDAIVQNENIIIHADVDLDGITAGTIMYRYLKHWTNNVHCIINQGKQHGLQGTDLSKFDKADLIIVCDSLDSNTETYEKLCAKGKTIIVLDHHDIDPNIDYSMITLVSSYNSDNPDLSGAGVCFKLCQLYDKQAQSHFSDEFYDLATCGIIGDMCSMLSMENRAICNQGFNNISNPFIKHITKGFGFNSKSVMYSIAPLINSANRTNQNELALRVFLTDDEKELKQYIKLLKKCKEFQNFEVDNLLPHVVKQCETQKNNPVLCVQINTEYNLSGLIGNKLLGMYKKPVIVLRNLIDDTYYGSGRSVCVKDFRQMCSDTGLCKANGHASAFGFEIKKQVLNLFLQEINSKLANYTFEQSIDVDILLNPEDITPDLVNQIKEFDRITGTNCPPVSVMVSTHEYEVSSMSGGKHLVLKPNNQLDIIQWNYSGDITQMEEHSLFGDEIIAVGNLDSGYLGRRFSLKLIASSIEVT